MTISKSLDEKFIDRLRYTVNEQQRLIDSLQYDQTELAKKALKLCAELTEISERTEDLARELVEETYFLEKFNKLLELHLIGELPKKEISYEKEEQRRF